jgi:hypothetical protein
VSIVSSRDAKKHPTELKVPSNESPVFDSVPLNFAAGAAYLHAKGITHPVPFIAEDFEEPLPEDFLLKPIT